MFLIENQPLAPLTTFGIGGPARWFAEAATEGEIEEAVAWSIERKIDLFILGGGSNLLVADTGFNGLVLKIGLPGIETIDSGGQSKVLRAGAGVSWDDCVNYAITANCAGIECLAGIPGTVGGTPVQNVGAYGQEVSTVIDRVRAYDRHSGAFVEMSAADCSFSYRRSRFNTSDRDRFIVTRVDYRLTRDGAPTIRYPELARALMETENPSLIEVAAAVRVIRRNKGMLLVEGDPNCRSAGSFFKNPVVREERAPEIAERSTGLSFTRKPPQYPAGPGEVKLSAAWLIEEAGFHRGYRLGNAGISRRHTLALVNYGEADQGGASAADILALADQIRAAVRAQFGIELEMEPAKVGF
ncbi:MAG: UDP-N-acetylmuramate dehydrogenase [Terracidiphilus sp.]|jgi:UDP-N-acetylmuramate dehydrogenase